MKIPTACCHWSVISVIKAHGYIILILCSKCRLGESGDAVLMRHEGRGSEGFLEHVFKHAAKELFGQDVHEITYKNLR